MRSLKRPLLQPWLPCVLGALGLHGFLLAVWTTSAPAVEQTDSTAAEPACTLRLAAHSMAEPDASASVRAQKDGEEQALKTRARLLAALHVRAQREEWEGEFDTGRGYTGCNLLVTSDGYVQTDWSCLGQDSTEGTLEAGPDLVTLHPKAAGSRSVRYFVMPWEGFTYLVPADEMRDFLRQANEGFLTFPTRGPAFLHKRGTSRADQRVAPDSYCDLWTSLPQFRVQRVTPSSGARPTLLEFSLPAAIESAEAQLTLFWEGDASGCVRAIEREREGDRLVAFVDACEDAAPHDITVGASFRSLPRLR